MSDHYVSGLAEQLAAFVRHRRAAGSWNDSYAENLRYFDRHCALSDPGGLRLIQRTLDEWCKMRGTEAPGSCYIRTMPARLFADYARGRGLTDATPPKMAYVKGPDYVPHAFTNDELARFFSACDSIVPYMNRPASLVRKVTCPAFFRLLYSSGIRTTEARLLKRVCLLTS
jgi:integrase